MRHTRTSTTIQVPLLIVAAVVVLSMGLAAFGSMRVDESVGLVCLGIGMLGLFIAGAAMAIVLAFRASIESVTARTSSQTVATSAEQLLAQIHENSMLSDNAKRVLFRDRELELLRRAIEDDIRHGDYSSGLTLCDEMANLFGHREEAEDFRLRIHQANHAAYEEKVHQAINQLDQVLAMRDWARAHRDAASIRRLYPAHHLVQDVEQRILRSREEHKRGLEAEFVDAANRDDFTRAMLLLKELDKYLTREEAARLAETAQEVVVKHRDNLSMQFKLAVNDHRWAEAAQIGDLIIAEYPNTKMADEVRSMIDVLRVRATQAAVMAENS